MAYSLTFFVTSRCNLNCPYCIQAPLLRLLGDYEVSLQELDRIIRRARELGVIFDFIQLSGGEPLLWSHLREGLTRLRASGITRKLSIFSNGMHPEKLAEVMPLMDHVRLSHYGRINDASIRATKARFPDKVEVWREVHRGSPTSALADTLPAACRCQNQAYVDRRFYVCGNAIANCLCLGLDPSSPEISCSIDDDFRAHFVERAVSRSRHSMCSSCLGNVRVWKRVADTEWRGEHPQWEPEIKRWAVGMTAADRPVPHLRATLDSLAAAGWPDTLVFHDEGKRLGAWSNWLRAVRGLLDAVRSADALLVVQDDAVFCRGLRRYLEQTLWPDGGAAICSPYCPGIYGGPRPGWHRQDHGWALVGAVCWAMPRAAAEAILHDLGAVVATHRIDAWVGRWAAERKQRVWYHWPSLAQHEGIGNSALGDAGAGAIRYATHFVGADFCAGKDPWP